MKLILIILTLCHIFSVIAKPSFIQKNLLDTTRSLKAYLSQKNLPIETCLIDMKESFTFLKKSPISFYQTEYFASENREILNNLWDIKVLLRKQSRVWVLKNEMNSECVSQVKASLRAVRFIEDLVGINYHNQISKDKTTGLQQEDNTPIFSRDFPWTSANKSFFNYKKDLKSGDILMWRGSSTISASIARLGDNENNFSHLSIIYIHPVTKKIYNVEALIEVGLVVRDFEKLVEKGVSKLVVYRHEDSQLSKRLANFAYHKANERSKTSFIPYDFTFDLNDHSQLFCSELITWAFDEASNGKLKVPMFKTKVELKNRSYVDAIGFTGNTAFQPGDIELEPSLKMVAEWRNFKQVRVNSLMDNILSNIYRWMEDYNYSINWNLRGNLLGSSLHLFRKAPIAGTHLLGASIPSNMPKATLNNILSLDKIASLIYKEAFKRLYGDTNHKLYSFRDVEEVIEKIRLDDLEKYNEQLINKKSKRVKKVLFHRLFKPKLHSP